MNENTNTNEITKAENLELTAMPSVSEMIFDDAKFARMHQFAEIMASATCTIPRHLQGKPGDCFAIIAQAAQWRMNPIVVAQKTHLVNGALAYEAQLINAVIKSMNVISGRFHYEYVGDWEGFRKAAFVKAKEAGCGVSVGAVIKGETEITWMPMPLFMESVTTRNSPLWKTNPQQQLAYLAVKYWVRLYAPDALLGVYSDDELAVTEAPVAPAPIPPTPEKKSRRQSVKEKLGINPAEAVDVEVVPEPQEKPQPLVSERIQAIIDMTGAPVTVEEVVAYLQSLGYCKEYGLDEIEKYPENFRNRMAGDLTNLVNQAAEFTNK